MEQAEIKMAPKVATLLSTKVILSNMLPDNIVEPITNMADQKYPFVGREKLMATYQNAQQKLYREAYASGQIDAIEMMLKFILFIWRNTNRNTSTHLKEINKGKLWHDGQGNNFTTLELLEIYLKEEK